MLVKCGLRARVQDLGDERRGCDLHDLCVRACVRACMCAVCVCVCGTHVRVRGVCLMCDLLARLHSSTYPYAPLVGQQWWWWWWGGGGCENVDDGRRPPKKSPTERNVVMPDPISKDPAVLVGPARQRQVARPRLRGRAGRVRVRGVSIEATPRARRAQ